MYSGCAEHVECVLCLLYEPAPKDGREVLVAYAKSSDEVIFERLYGSFGCVDSVVMWLDKLYFYVFCFEVVFDRCGGDVVDDVV